MSEVYKSDVKQRRSEAGTNRVFNNTALGKKQHRGKKQQTTQRQETTNNTEARNNK